MKVNGYQNCLVTNIVQYLQHCLNIQTIQVWNDNRESLFAELYLSDSSVFQHSKQFRLNAHKSVNTQLLVYKYPALKERGQRSNNALWMDVLKLVMCQPKQYLQGQHQLLGKG